MKTQLHLRAGSTVSIPNEIMERIEKRFPRNEFESAEDYIAFVLGEVLNEIEIDESSLYDKHTRRRILSKAELDEIKEEIRPLSMAYP